MRMRKNVWRAGAAACLAAVVLSGCSVEEVLTSVSKGEKEYGHAETMMILSTELLRYEEVYTEDVWSAVVDDHGTDFETVLLSQIHDFMIELKTMSNMAEEHGIELTSREKDLVKEAASRYFEALGSSQAEVFGLELETVNGLYTDYWTAEKLVESLTDDMNLEVSDSEAKVITVAQIELSDMEEATQVWEKVSADGADFIAIAKEVSEDEEVKKQIHYGFMDKEYEQAAFGLEEGEISDVVVDSGKYYVLKCIDDYDEEATRIHKEVMIQEKKNEAFHSSYQAYKAENPLSGDSELWEGLSVAECPKVNADFFEIFDVVCRENQTEQE